MDNVLGSITDAPEPDLKIYCGSCEITVHKSVIYPQSEYYARVCEGNPLPVSPLARRNIFNQKLTATGSKDRGDHVKRRRPRHSRANGLLLIPQRLPG